MDKNVNMGSNQKISTIKLRFFCVFDFKDTKKRRIFLRLFCYGSLKGNPLTPRGSIPSII